METKQTNSKQEHYKRTNNKGVTLKITSIPGQRRYLFDKEGKDRIYLMELSKNGDIIDYAITFEEELVIMEKVISNKILLGPRKEYIQRVREMLNKIDV